MLSFIILIVLCVIFGFATMTINNNKGYEGGFWLGFFLGIIGLIIVACKPDKEIIDKRMISNGGWKCIKCGTIHPSYVEKCIKCGNTKQANDAREQKMIEDSKKEPIVLENADSELLNLQKLKAYKDLLDSGVISQEEFDKKKAELL